MVVVNGMQLANMPESAVGQTLAEALATNQQQISLALSFSIYVFQNIPQLSLKNHHL